MHVRPCAAGCRLCLPDQIAWLACSCSFCDMRSMLTCRYALQQQRPEELAGLMTENFWLRRKMFGDDVIGPRNLHMVELVQSVGGEGMPATTS